MVRQYLQLTNLLALQFLEIVRDNLLSRVYRAFYLSRILKGSVYLPIIDFLSILIIFILNQEYQLCMYIQLVTFKVHIV